MFDASASAGVETDDESSVFSLSRASLSSPGNTASPSQAATKLIRAAGNGDLDQVIRILDTTSASVNTLRARGSTALHEASKAGRVSVVTELVKRSAQVNDVNRSGSTALHFAVLCKDKSRSLEIVDMLLNANSMVNAMTERMDTPLHFAAYCQPPAPGCVEVIKTLLERRAMVNARNKSQETPLINATKNSNAEIVSALMTTGADIYQRNSMDKSALDIARENGCSEILQVIEAAKDPQQQLNDVTQQMRTALNQMQTVDRLSGELRRQTACCEAFENIAAAAVQEMDVNMQMALAQQAFNALRAEREQDSKQSSPRNSGPPLGAAQRRPGPPTTLQALVTFLVVSRTRGGARILHSIGIMEALPYLEQHVDKNQIGHKELRELNSRLSTCQMDLLDNEMRTDRSSSSTPSSINEMSSATSHRTRMSTVTGSAQSQCLSRMSTSLSKTAEEAACSESETTCDTDCPTTSCLKSHRHSVRSSGGRGQQGSHPGGLHPLFINDSGVLAEEQPFQNPHTDGLGGLAYASSETCSNAMRLHYGSEQSGFGSLYSASARNSVVSLQTPFIAPGITPPVNESSEEEGLEGPGGGRQQRPSVTRFRSFLSGVIGRATGGRGKSVFIT